MGEPIVSGTMAPPGWNTHRGDSRGGLAVLQPVYDRFTEGFGTADLIAAKRLLDDLNDVRCG